MPSAHWKRSLPNAGGSRIVLHSDSLAWALGSVAKGILRAPDAHGERVLLSSSRLYARQPRHYHAVLRSSDLVHVLAPGLLPDLPEDISSSKMILSVNHTDPRSCQMLVSLLDSRLAGFVTPTPETARVLENLGVAREQIHVLPYGVDTQFFKPPTSRVQCRRFLGLREGQTAIGFFGRPSNFRPDRKGTDRFVRAMACMKQDRSIDLCLILSGQEITWRPYLAELRNEGVPFRFLQYLPQSDLPTVLGGLDLYTVTSRAEGGPLTMLESLACGTPVASTAVGMARTLIAEHGLGTLLPANDPAEMAKRMKAAILDRETTWATARRGLRFIRSHYDWAVIGPTYRRTYQTLIAKPSRLPPKTSVVGHHNCVAILDDEISWLRINFHGLHTAVQATKGILNLRKPLPLSTRVRLLTRLITTELIVALRRLRFSLRKLNLTGRSERCL